MSMGTTADVIRHRALRRAHRLNASIRLVVASGLLLVPLFFGGTTTQLLIAQTFGVCFALTGFFLARRAAQSEWLLYPMVLGDFVAASLWSRAILDGYYQPDIPLSIVYTAISLLILLMYGSFGSIRVMLFIDLVAATFLLVGLSGSTPSAGTLAQVVLVVAGSLALWTMTDRNQREVQATIERSLLERFLPDQLVAQHIVGKQELQLGGHEAMVTILFTDLVGFTALAENMTPSEVVVLVNNFLTRVTEQVFAHGGTLDKFVGDQAMAIFGAPTEAPDDAVRAMRCALAIQDEMTEWNAERTAAGMPLIIAGVGLHTGSVIAGNIGSPRRMDYTVMGDAVNVAARVEGLTRTLDASILCTEATVSALAGSIQTVEMGELSVKGRGQHVRVFRPVR
jgi:adenylate cyclase